MRGATEASPPPYLLWISEGGRRTKQASRRLANLRQQEAALAGNVFLHVVPQLWGEESTVVAIKKLLMLKLHVGLKLASSPETLLLLTQDDVQLCGDVLPELRLSLAELPSDWRTLHLCAGYLWGRSSEKARLDAELPDVVPERAEWFVPRRGRHGERLINLFAPAWPGGPLAMIIRRKDVPSLLRDLEETAPEMPDDLSLQRVARPQDFLQRGVLLCHEREHGASQNTQGRLAGLRQSLAAVGAAAALVSACLARRASGARLGFALLALMFAVVLGLLLLPRLRLSSGASVTIIPPSEPEFDLTLTEAALLAPTVHSSVEAAANAMGISQSCSALPPGASRLLTGLSKLYRDGGCLQSSGELTQSDLPPAGCLCRLGCAENNPAFFPLAAMPGSALVLSAALAMLRADRCGVTDEETLLWIPSRVIAVALSGEDDLGSSELSLIHI